MKKNCLVRNDGDDSGDKTSIDTQTSFGTEEVRASQGPYGFLRDISSAKYKSKCICTARIWASGCFVAVSAYEDRLALFSMSGIGNDIVDEEEAYLKTSFLRVPTMIMKAKLKQQCGGQFTSKMEGMIGSLHIPCLSLFGWSTKNYVAFCFHQVTNLTLAKENQTSFEEYLSNNPNVDPGIDLTVTVLTNGFWPSYKSFDLNLPTKMGIT
ncbi:hypothetical protein HN51_054818 [Arachis hypogaea]